VFADILRSYLPQRCPERTSPSGSRRRWHGGTRPPSCPPSGCFAQAVIGRWWVAVGVVALAVGSMVGGIELLGTTGSGNRAPTSTTTLATTVPARFSKGAAASGRTTGEASQKNSAGTSGVNRGNGGAVTTGGSGDHVAPATATGTPASPVTPLSVPETGFIILLPLIAGAMLLVAILRTRVGRSGGRPTAS